MTRLVVNLTPSAVDALRTSAERSGFSETDTVSRALNVYAALVSAVVDGDDKVTVEELVAGGGKTTLLVLPPGVGA